MHCALSHHRCLPASTSGRCSSAASDYLEICPASTSRLLGRLTKSRTLLFRRGPCLWSSANRRGGPLPACSPRTAAVNIHCLHSGSSGAAKRDVTARARSTPGQVGVALVEEVVDATHPEVLRYSSLPGNFSTVRDSYLSIQNLESLTREAAKEVNGAGEIGCVRGCLVFIGESRSLLHA